MQTIANEWQLINVAYRLIQGGAAMLAPAYYDQDVKKLASLIDLSDDYRCSGRFKAWVRRFR